MKIKKLTGAQVRPSVNLVTYIIIRQLTGQSDRKETFIEKEAL